MNMSYEDLMIIPSQTDSFEYDIKKRKNKYMDHIYNSFTTKIVVGSEIPEKIYLFRFKDTNLEVLVKNEDFIINLENLMKYYIELEMYENCSNIAKLIKYINK